MRWTSLIAFLIALHGFSIALLGAEAPSLAPATPESQGVDAKRLAAALRYLEANVPSDGVRQTVILRHGRVIHAGPGADERHGVWSCTKSFTSTVLGLLIDDGKCSLDTRAAAVLPEMGKVFPDVTLRHFTTMTSGYRAVGDEPTARGYSHGPSRTPFEPAPEPLFAPGTKYAYWDSAMNQFAHVLTAIAGEKIEEYFRRRIAEPIGMAAAGWDWGEFADEEPAVNGGSGNSSRHMFITAREMARFGQLFLDGGRWGDRRLLSKEWVEAATSTQVAADVPLAHTESGILGPGSYGFNWWTNGLRADGTRKWPGAPEDTFAASGFNNNDMFVVPRWDLVAVRLGLDQSDGFAVSDEVYGEFLRRLGLALD